jgi:diaminopimelate decarboxylase
MAASVDLEGIPPLHDGEIPFSHNSAMLAEKYGTPLFVFVETAIRQNIAGVLQAFRSLSPAPKLFYASKANSNLAILQIVNSAGAGLEVNSGGELLKALHIGCPPGQIVFNGVAKSDEELVLALKHDIYSINVDSLGELKRLCRLAAASNSRPHVSLRVCADVEPGAGALHTGSASTKFGMDNLELEESLKLAVDEPIRFRGLHFHLGAQLTDLDDYRRYIRDLFLRAAQLRRRAINLEAINIGGGFPVSFAKPIDLAPCNNSWSLEAQRKFGSVPPLDAFGNVVQQEFRTAFGEHGGPQLLIEPDLYNGDGGPAADQGRDRQGTPGFCTLDHHRRRGERVA